MFTFRQLVESMEDQGDGEGNGEDGGGLEESRDAMARDAQHERKHTAARKQTTTSYLEAQDDGCSKPYGQTNGNFNTESSLSGEKLSEGRNVLVVKSENERYIDDGQNPPNPRRDKNLLSSYQQCRFPVQNIIFHSDPELVNSKTEYLEAEEKCTPSNKRSHSYEQSTHETVLNPANNECNVDPWEANQPNGNYNNAQGAISIKDEPADVPESSQTSFSFATSLPLSRNGAQFCHSSSHPVLHTTVQYTGPTICISLNNPHDNQNCLPPPQNVINTGIANAYFPTHSWTQPGEIANHNGRIARNCQVHSASTHTAHGYQGTQLRNPSISRQSSKVSGDLQKQKRKDGDQLDKKNLERRNEERCDWSDSTNAKEYLEKDHWIDDNGGYQHSPKNRHHKSQKNQMPDWRGSLKSRKIEDRTDYSQREEMDSYWSEEPHYKRASKIKSGSEQDAITVQSSMSQHPDGILVDEEMEAQDINSSSFYRCQECGVRLRDTASYIRHQRLHSPTRPYACLDCPSRFNQLVHLQIHQRTHTGERPFQCSICDSSFSRKDRLRAHERIHSGEKPYPCPYCQFSFRDAAQLRFHMSCHTLKPPYTCCICHAPFAHLSTFTSHWRDHISPS